MKNALLTGMLLLIMAVAAEAQGVGAGGYGYGYRSGRTGPGWGYTGNLGGSFGYGPLYTGAHRVFPRVNYSGFGGYGVYPGYFGYGGGSSFYYHGPAYGLDAPYGYGAYRRAYRAAGLATDYTPGWANKRGVADRAHELAAVKEIDAGRAFLKKADYARALDRFREAVLVHTDNGRVQSWFALGLAASGDAANAEKALRGAAEFPPAARPALGGLFRDAKEQGKVLARFKPGSLVGAWLRYLGGDDKALKALAAKDESAAALLKP